MMARLESAGRKSLRRELPVNPCLVSPGYLVNEGFLKLEGIM